MKLAVVQLSDIHIRKDMTRVLKRAEAIAGAVRGELGAGRSCLIAITGDIAFAGMESEYQIASPFVDDLVRAFRMDFDNVELAIIPGNHDCNFQKEKDARPILLQNEGALARNVKPGGEIARQLLEVQQEFFHFEASASRRPELPLESQLFFVRTFEVDTKTIRFNCFNTAWVSRKDELQGQLVFPVNTLSLPINQLPPADLTISLLHHPYNWLEANNARELKELVERTSDMVLTGHEHVKGSYRKSDVSSGETHYIEGAVLQEPTGNDSGFNVIEIDLEETLRYRTVHLLWNGSAHYLPATKSAWIGITGKLELRRFPFINNEEFWDTLTDPGTGFTHPRKRQLRLNDLFIYPDLKRLSFGKNKPDNALAGEKLVDLILKEKNVFIVGPDDSGKTSLARKTYVDLKRHREVVPLLITGNDIRLANQDLQQLMRDMFTAQYSRELLDRYLQLPRESRVLIVDDFSHTRLNKKGQHQFLESAEKFFGYIVCFANDLFQIEQIAQREEDTNPFHGFEVCEIKEFGYFLRGKLIEQWYLLGQELTIDDSAQAHEIAESEKLITAVLGKNLLPSYPVTILTVLQTREANRSHNTATGSYGYLYEVLITGALALVSKRGTDLDTKFTFISELAYAIFKSDGSNLTTEEINEIGDAYFRQYKIRLDTSRLLDDLQEAQIVQLKGDGTYAIKYKYCYYYFVAKYFQINLANVSEAVTLRGELRDIADRVYYEDYANIIIFFIYLTRDRELIEYTLASAKQIYDDHPAWNLDRDVAFVNKLYRESPKIILPLGDSATHRGEHRKALDSVPESSGEQSVEKIEGRSIKYDRSLDDLIKVNISFKTLQILGQILRKFPGSLRADIKHSLAQESYLLGLRTLKAMFTIFENDWEGVRTFVSEIVKEHKPPKDDKELARRTDEWLARLMEMLAASFVKRISYSVGLEELKETYRGVLEHSGVDNNAVKLIDVSIKLDHFQKVPEADIVGLAAILRKNPFAHNLLREMVAQYMLMFPVEYRARDRLGKLMDIETHDPRMLIAASKKHARLGPGDNKGKCPRVGRRKRKKSR